MKITNVTYICNENILSVFLSPLSIISIIIFGIAIAFIALFEVGALCHAFSLSQLGKKTKISGMISSGIHVCKKLIYPKNWIAIPFVVVILPLTGIMNIATSTLKVLIPGFIEEFILSNGIYAMLLLLAYIVLTIIVLSYIYALNFFTLTENNFVACCKKSRSLMHKKIINTILMLILFSVLFSWTVIAIAATLSSIYRETKSFFTADGSKMAITEMYNLADNIFTISGFCRGILLPVLNIAALSTLFFKRMDEQERLNEFKVNAFKDEQLSKPQKLVFCTAIILVVIYNAMHFSNELPSYLSAPGYKEIVAHRGNSVEAPENSMPAFKLALYTECDGIELDVHETKDGVIIVSHDDNLKRISGKDVCVHNLTYDEVMQLEVGSWFAKTFEGLKLSTLDEVLKECKDTDVTVQIEIKPTEFDHEIEEKVLKVINDNGMHDRVTIVSLKAKPLLRMKELDPTISTTYCMAVAWGDVQDIPFADNISVEENNINPYFVEKIHGVNKKVYAWTVNNQSTVQYLVYSDVDGILTDDPMMMDDALYMADYSGGIKKLLHVLSSRLVSGY